MAQYDMNLREYWRILKKRKFIVILTALLLGIFSTFFAYVQAPVPLYKSSCSIKFEKETALKGLYASTLTWSGSDDIETKTSLINSYSVMLEVAMNLGLIPKKAIDANRLEPGMISIVEGLQSKVQVTRESHTNIINIQVTDSDPEFAQRLANTIASSYKALHSDQQSKRTEEAIEYISNQLDEMKRKLTDAEGEFNSFSQRNQLLSIDMQSENLLLRSKEIKDEIRKINETQGELEGLSKKVSAFIEDPSGSGESFYTTNAGPQYQSINDKLVSLIFEKDGLLENFTQIHPDVVAVGQKIIENAKKLELLLEQQLENLRKRERDFNNELKELNEKTNLLMEKKLEYDRLKREVESFRDMTALLEQKNQEAQIRKAEKPEEVIIVKLAQRPSSPINPPKKTVTGVMGAIIGIILGLILAFIVETFDTSLGAIEDVEETLGAKVLGVIPQADPKDIQERLKDVYPDGIDEQTLSRITNMVSHFAPKSMIAESFRALRTNIQFKEGEEKVKAIAVTSTSPQEGKTTVSINLAISLAQAGLKTLLVGSDLRKPMMSKIFGIEVIPGLTDILLGNCPWTDTIKTITDIIMGKMTMDEVMITPGMDNLHIITCGTIPPNPAELLQSRRLMEFIEEAKKEYDIILFDSTPVLSTADSTILGKKVDGVLIVYRVGAVSKGLLKRSSAQLEQVNCKIVGVILNGMKPDINPDSQDLKCYKYYCTYEEADRKGETGFARFLSFMKWGKDGEKNSENALPSSAGSEIEEEDKKKGGSFFRIFFILLVVLFFALGVLWHQDLIDPIKLIHSDEGPMNEERGRNPVIRHPEAPVQNEKKSSDVEELYPPVDRVNNQADHPVGEKSKVAQLTETKNQSIPGKISISPYIEGTFPYSIYLGSFRTWERAQKAIEYYHESGVSTYSVKVDLGKKGIWYRIYLGFFKTDEEALEFGNEKGIKEIDVRKTGYANLIHSYMSREEAQEAFESLDNQRYSPYIVEDQEGIFRLIIGAFLTEKGAFDQSKELISHNIDNKVIRR